MGPRGLECVVTLLSVSDLLFLFMPQCTTTQCAKGIATATDLLIQTPQLPKSRCCPVDGLS